MKNKIAKILLYLTLTMVATSFLPWIYLTPYYNILRYGIMLSIATNVALTFNFEKIFNERFMRLFALSILLVLVEFICFRLLHRHFRLEDLSQMITAFLCITLGINMESDLKQWGNTLFYFTLALIGVCIANCLYYAGGLYIPEKYMFNEGKNQLGGMIAIAGAVCYFFGIKEKNLRTSFFVLFLLSLLMLLLIRSRSDCFALLACALFLSIKEFNYKIQWNVKKIITIAGILLIGYIIYNAFLADELHTFMVGGKYTDNLNEVTSNRMERNHQAIEFFIHDPVRGEQIEESGILLIHNYILLRLVRYGIWSLPLVGFYLYFGFITIFALLRTRKTKLCDIGYVACIIPLIVSLVEPNFPYGPGSVQLMAFLLLGVSFQQNRSHPITKQQKFAEGKNQKVLHICNDFPNSKVHTELYQHIDHLGIKQIIYSPIRDKRLKGRNYFDGSHSNIIYSLILKPIHRILFNRKIDVIVKDLRHKVDLSEIGHVHATNLFSDGAVALHLKQHYGLPYIVAVRNSDLNVFLKMPHLWWVHRAVIREAEKVVFISAAHAQRLERHYTLVGMRKILKNKYIIQPNGINPYWLKHLNLTTEQHIKSHRICYVGIFDDNKNVLRLIESVLELKNDFPDIHLDLVGGGGNREQEVLQMVNRHADTLRYLGKIFDKDKLQSVYLQNSIFAMPSIHETFGLVYIEALSQGLSLLYTKNEGIDHLFNTPIGEGVTPTCSTEITHALRQLLSYPENYTQLLPDAFQTFNWENIAKRYISLYGINA